MTNISRMSQLTCRSNNPRTTSRIHARIGRQNSTISSTINITLLVYTTWGNTDCFTIVNLHSWNYATCRRKALAAAAAAASTRNLSSDVSWDMCCSHSQTEMSPPCAYLPEICVHSRFTKFSPRGRSIIPMSSCRHEGLVTWVLRNQRLIC